MNKEYIFYPARQVSKAQNVYEHMMHEYNDLKNDYDALQQENKQLKDNWNELKEILNDTLENGFPEMRLFAKMVLRDMQKLEDK